MSITKNSDDYDEKHMKINFNSNDELALNKKYRNFQHGISCYSCFS